MSKLEELLGEMIAGFEAKKSKNDEAISTAESRIKSDNDLIAQSKDESEGYEKEIERFRSILLTYQEDQRKKLQDGSEAYATLCLAHVSGGITHADLKSCADICAFDIPEELQGDEEGQQEAIAASG